jgi:L-iditol 2-dehydrogenase
MKGLVKYQRGRGFLAIREVVEPPLAPDEVRIAIAGCGICGSDLHIFDDEIAIPIRVPVVLGHEFSGTVVEVGTAVTKTAVGDRVTAEPRVRACGRCPSCREGSTNLCSERRIMGYWIDGAFARTGVVPERCIHKLPENVDLLSAALTEPLACGVHAVTELTGVSAGDVVVITGPGTIGLLTTQVAKAEGGSVVVVGRSGDEPRLSLARTLGADATINVDTEDPIRVIQSLADGDGADVVFECSGAEAGASLGLKLARKQGTYTQVGLFGRPIQIDFEQIAFKELSVTGSLGQKPTSWERSLKLMASGKVQTAPLVTHQLPLIEWEEAFRIFREREGIKVILRPD